MEGHQSGRSSETSPVDALLPQTPAINNRENFPEVPNIPEDLDLSLLNEPIGKGYCGNVFKYTMSSGIVVAVKCCDKNNNVEGYRMMKNEVFFFYIFIMF